MCISIGGIVRILSSGQYVYINMDMDCCCASIVYTFEEGKTAVGEGGKIPLTYVERSLM